MQALKSSDDACQALVSWKTRPTHMPPSACYRVAGRCSALQGGGEGPSYGGSAGAVLVFDVLVEHGQWGAPDRSGDVGT